ncbi:hypothetical protein GCM10028799_36590 [Kribbella italica]|nr:DUF6318 family protein [Kribbella italica]
MAACVPFLTAVLAACSTAGPEAGSANTGAPSRNNPTPSSTSAASPPSVPERPDSANGLSLAAAEGFVRYYSSLLNYASATGNAAPMLGASDPGCENCKGYADFVRKSNGANGLMKGDYAERVGEVAELVQGESGRVGGSATIQVGLYVSRRTPTDTPFTSKATTYTREFALSARSANWVMYEMKLVER